jgi:hypothetical protein
MQENGSFQMLVGSSQEARLPTLLTAVEGRSAGSNSPFLSFERRSSVPPKVGGKSGMVSLTVTNLNTWRRLP